MYYALTNWPLTIRTVRTDRYEIWTREHRLGNRNTWATHNHIWTNTHQEILKIRLFCLTKLGRFVETIVVVVVERSSKIWPVKGKFFASIQYAEVITLRSFYRNVYEVDIFFYNYPRITWSDAINGRYGSLWGQTMFMWIKFYQKLRLRYKNTWTDELTYESINKQTDRQA